MTVISGRWRTVAACAVVVTATVVGLLGASPAVVDAGSAVAVNGEGAASMAAVDELVEEFLENEDFAGATVAITRGSRLVWSKGYGYADSTNGVEMQPEHRSRIGSTSKMLTAIAAMQLVEQGAIDLDQHLYSSDIAPLWGSEGWTTPGAIVGTDGALEDPADYVSAMIAGVDALGEYFPPADHVDEIPSLPWALLLQASYEQQITMTLERASDVQVRNVLSHTAGYLRSGSNAEAAAADHFGVSIDEVTSAQHHQAVLMGSDGAPFSFDPGTAESYSNQGFSVAGLLIEEASEEGSYRDYVEQHLLGPLGLTDVVPNNANLGALDTVGHSSDGAPLDADPTAISRLGLATGGWKASARDLARIMCSTDQTANHLRSLEPETVVEMADDAVAGAPGTNPIGWDASDGTEMTKNGDSSGGASRISKFLPGAFATTDDEINVAMVVNQSDGVPSTTLLRDVAEVAAEADVPSTYDLFDPAHPCRIDPGFTTVTESVPTSDPEPSPSIVIRRLSVDPEDVHTLDSAGRPCAGEPPAEVSAHVGASSELQSVELTWRIGEGEPAEPLAMETVDGRRFVAELDPFDEGTLPAGPSTPLTLMVTATDATGTTATAEHEVTLRRCELSVRG